MESPAVARQTSLSALPVPQTSPRSSNASTPTVLSPSTERERKRGQQAAMIAEQRANLRQLCDVVRDTLDLLRTIPERCYTVEWSLTHQFILKEMIERMDTEPIAESSASPTSPVVNLHSSGNKLFGPPQLMPPNASPLLVAEVILFERKFNELLHALLPPSTSTQSPSTTDKEATFRHPQQNAIGDMPHLGRGFSAGQLTTVATMETSLKRLGSARRRKSLQKLNSHIFFKFTLLWGIREGTYHSLIRDDEARNLWYTAFIGKFMVPWEKFVEVWRAKFEAQHGWTSKHTELLRRVIDPSLSGFVSALQFSEFLVGFGSLSTCVANFLDVVTQPWFHGYLSYEDTERLLRNEPPGTFLIRLRNMRPGAFALAVVLPGNTVQQIIIGQNAPQGYKIRDDEDRYITFSSLSELVEIYKRLLKQPFNSTINEQPWFHADLTGIETQATLAGQTRGKYLVRFSKDHPDCFATAYVDNNGDITHALIKKTVHGFQHGEDRLFLTLNQLLVAYQGVLSFPFIFPDVVEELSKEALEAVGLSHDDLAEKAGTSATKVKKSTKVFGEDLVEVMSQYTNYYVPLVAEQTIMFLYSQAKTPGIFNTTIGPEEAKTLKDAFDKGQPIDLWQEPNPHLAASLLKMYLRELPNPLLCNVLYKDFVSVLEMPATDQAAQLANVIQQLPAEHKMLLRYMIKLLIKVLDEAEHNQADIDMLARELGPTFLRSRETTMASTMTDTQKAINITKLIIQHAAELQLDLDKVHLDYVWYDDIVLLPNRTKIKLATKQMLVRTLYANEFLSSSNVTSYVPKFLLTYRAFMTPEELLDMLHAHFIEIQTNPPAQKKEEQLLRMCNFLKKWTEEHAYVFKEDEQLYSKYRNFVGGILDANLLRILMASLAKLDAIGKGEKPTKTRVFRAPPPKPLLPKGKGPITKIKDVKVQELARQMTLLEYKLFSKIQPQELCFGAWTKEDKEIKAPNLVRVARKFNTVVQWMVTLMVSAKKPSKREAIVNMLIELAVQFRDINNFNGIMEVVAALNSAPITRLPDIRRRLETSVQFQELREMMSHESNSRRYRETLDRCNPPLVPYIGSFQTDLVFIEDGHPLVLKDQIHFNKCYQIAEVIQKVQQYQQTPYNLQKLTVVRTFLENIQPLDDDACWALSLEIKPQARQA